MIHLNSECIEKEFSWLENLIKYQLGSADPELIDRIEKQGEIQPPSLESGTYYSDFILDNNINGIERGILLIALASYLKPKIFDPLLELALNEKLFDTRLGGIISNNQNTFIPTGETVIFLLTNDSIAERLIILDILENNHWFFEQQILIFDNIVPNRPLSQFSIHMTKDYVSKLTTGISNKPNFSISFPATLMTTNLDWEDIVLSDQVKEGLSEIELWIRFEKKILEDYGLGKKIKRGYKTVFYGPSGTGKTLAASLLGKKHGLDVYRIDLSQLVSKYIGETEKNLSNLFNQAANKNWILFFDEAESLFSKRTNNSSSNDKYANQQVGYLLQKIEEYPGVVILATNLKGNIDDAFLRRFQSMIYFEIPEQEQRFLLWKSAFGEKFILEECIDLKSIAKEYQLVGGQIINIVKSSILKELGNNSEVITEKILIESIKKELKKN